MISVTWTYISITNCVVLLFKQGASGGGSISSVNTTLEKYNHIFGVEKKSVPSSAANKPVLGDANSSRKNEVYIDILERLTVTLASAGNVVCSDIDGCVKVRSYLAGDPEIQMLLNDVIRENGDDASHVGGSSGLKQGVSSSVVLDDCRFHECVDTEEFNRSATLIFRPPAGESIVMKYHTTGLLEPREEYFTFSTKAANARINIFSTKFSLCLRIFQIIFFPKSKEMYMPFP